MTDHDIWRRRDMRLALATHDVMTVFKLLQSHGVSQRRIAAHTGQSQSEISEIMKGRRVWSYAVLVRIGNGLEVPRGYMGLSFDDETARLVEAVTTPEGEPLEVPPPPILPPLPSEGRRLRVRGGSFPAYGRT